MKLNIKIVFSSLLIAIVLLSMGACQDMLDTNSSRIAFEKDNQLKSANDLFYAISGIMAEVQKTGDKYVLFGELRGDLMTVSDNASVSLKEINEFQTTSGNVYADQRDYYNVINNCNYALQKIDTLTQKIDSSTVNQNENIMLPAYAVIKTIRAWTYMQLAQIYGKVTYFENPILNLETSLVNYPTMNIDDLSQKLITDLTPYINTPLPGSDVSPNNFVPVQIMLGDLYLYQNNYTQAAQMYYNYINAHSIVISSNYTSMWTSVTYDAASANHQNSYGNEVISSIYYNSDARELHSDLVSLSYNDKASLLPVKSFIDSMSLAPYFYSDKIGNNITATTQGDLRGDISFSKTKQQIGDAYSTENTGNNISTNLI